MARQTEVREIHFYAHKEHRSPLNTLQNIKELIENGFLAGQPIRLCFDQNIRGRTFRRVNFPASTKSESLYFTRIIKIICILIENLSKGQKVTRRDIYYKDVDLFQTQTKVDGIVNTLCQSLKLRDFELGAVASLKGLFYGVDVEYQLPGNVCRIFKATEDTQLIPRIYEIKNIKLLSSIDYILVVEKEAVFNLLTKDKRERRLVITGKGFPDQLTKAFVSKVSKSNPHIPLLGIADMDVYGFNILRQYRTGGNKLNKLEDNKQMMESISAPTLNPINLSIFGFIEGSISTLNQIEIPMMMKMVNSAEDEYTKKELQRMLFLGKKAELDNFVKAKEDKALECGRLIGQKCREKALKLKIDMKV